MRWQLRKGGQKHRRIQSKDQGPRERPDGSRHIQRDVKKDRRIDQGEQEIHPHNVAQVGNGTGGHGRQHRVEVHVHVSAARVQMKNALALQPMMEGGNPINWNAGGSNHHEVNERDRHHRDEPGGHESPSFTVPAPRQGDADE